MKAASPALSSSGPGTSSVAARSQHAEVIVVLVLLLLWHAGGEPRFDCLDDLGVPGDRIGPTAIALGEAMAIDRALIVKDHGFPQHRPRIGAGDAGEGLVIVIKS